MELILDQINSILSSDVETFSDSIFDAVDLLDICQQPLVVTFSDLVRLTQEQLNALLIYCCINGQKEYIPMLTNTNEIRINDELLEFYLVPQSPLLSPPDEENEDDEDDEYDELSDVYEIVEYKSANNIDQAIKVLMYINNHAIRQEIYNELMISKLKKQKNTEILTKLLSDIEKIRKTWGKPP